MKKGTKLSAAALAGLMALSMTACGAASDTTPSNGGYGNYGRNNSGYTTGSDLYNGGRTDTENGTMHRNGPAADSNVRRSGGGIGQDIGNTVRDATDGVKRFFDDAVENGRVKDNHDGDTANTNRTAGTAASGAMR